MFQDAEVIGVNEKSRSTKGGAGGGGSMYSDERDTIARPGVQLKRNDKNDHYGSDKYGDGYGGGGGGGKSSKRDRGDWQGDGGAPRKKEPRQNGLFGNALKGIGGSRNAGGMPKRR